MALSIKSPFGKKATGTAPAAVATPAAPSAGPAGGGSGIPLIGKLPVAQQYSALAIALIAVIVALGIVIAVDINQANQLTSGVSITGETLMHSQRLAKAVPNAIQNNAGLDIIGMLNRFVAQIDWAQMTGGIIVAALLVYVASEYRHQIILT